MEYYYITADLSRGPAPDEHLPVAGAGVYAGRIRAIVLAEDPQTALHAGKEIVNTCLKDGVKATNFGWMPEKDAIELGDKEIYDSDDNYRTVTKISALRINAGMTQRQLADAAGVNIRMVQYLENGERRIDNSTLKTALSLAEALGVDVRSLM